MSDETRPRRFRDGLGDYAHYAGAPWGAIVDGYQMINTVWHRIDEPGDIDLEAFRGTHSVFSDWNLEQAFTFAQESIGELEASPA